MTTKPLPLTCPGLQADSVNAWLAAIGATVLVPGLRLSWTDQPIPVAVLDHPDKSPAAALAQEWPTRERLDAMPVARRHPDSNAVLERRVNVEAFVERVAATRRHVDAWTLTSTMTDLAVGGGEVRHGPFDPPGPGSTKWLHHRLEKSYGHVTDPATHILESLAGVATPVAGFGLGFDIARLTAGKNNYVYPAVEVLAFFGLALFPVRGDGLNYRNPVTRQRGWRIGQTNNFKWPAWGQALERHGIDALLDAWHSSWRYKKPKGGTQLTGHWYPDRRMWKRLGVRAAWESTRYQTISASDPTRGYGSRRI